MFEFVEKVVYINLNERIDRRAEVESELLRIFPANIVERFPAIRHTQGAIGCTLSHIAVLERAKSEGWKNVLVVEDDMVWNSPDLLESAVQVQRIVDSNNWDVILFSGCYVECSSEGRVHTAQTSTCYLIRQEYYDTLLSNLRESVARLMSGGNYAVFALDQYWKCLQPRDRWWIALPMACYQRPGFSDIEGRVVDYRQYFFAKVK
jgi:glycosyl transferase family 25